MFAATKATPTPILVVVLTLAAKILFHYGLCIKERSRRGEKGSTLSRGGDLVVGGLSKKKTPLSSPIIGCFRDSS